MLRFWISPKSALSSRADYALFSMPGDFTPCSHPPAGLETEPVAVAISAEGVLCDAEFDFVWEGGVFAHLQKQALDSVFIGLLRERPCYVIRIENHLPGKTLVWRPLRALLENVEPEAFALISRAVQMLTWFRDHSYCGRCGEPTEAIAGEHARCCEACKLTVYPRISPCVIVLVTRGDECLLARNAAWTENFHSALAGFIEAGESVEGALHREIYEEVGITVTNLRYFSSESWPFPGQLMLGFFADYLAGDITLDRQEIAEAGWYRYDRLPNYPGTISLSGRLIRNFIDTHQPGGTAS